ncbi:MAG: DUF1501 domain-containing protein [Pirellulaceae bacterium]|nr:DUF1501 domain-containing protein [Pirellulaceae bacterium]MDP7017807.1 DUF1501 domain-containing protein [Pirellulaceae bacterium]
MLGTGCSDYQRAMLQRRTFLGAGIGGLALPAILQSRALAAVASKAAPDTAVIQYWLGGAASHQETYDPKPDAPVDFRGPFRAISTNVPGIQICETLPRHAKLIDKVTLIRSMGHDNSDHQHGMHWCQTGHDAKANGVNPFKGSSHPSIGSITSKVRGSNHRAMPSYVHIGYPLDEVPGRHFPHSAAHIGRHHDPYVILDKRTGDGKDPGQDRSFRVGNLDLTAGLTLSSISDRRELLAQMDRLRRETDASGMMDAMDHFHQAAFEMMTGPRARNAFDLEQEDDRTRERYGPTRPGQTALLARRLVEAGVTFVTVVDPGVGLSSSGWDLHRRLEWGMKTACPRMDCAVTALIEDLYERGLDKKVLLVVWGEFGRTPRINKDAGRDHWGDLQSVLVAGGGFRCGQVIGSSTARGEVPQDRRLWPYDMVATMYHHLGVNSHQAFNNLAGRPVPVLEKGEPIRELL